MFEITDGLRGFGAFVNEPEDLMIDAVDFLAQGL